MLSLKCSSLIDVLKYATYNIHMEENAVVNLLAIETATPKWRIARSAGAVYIMLIALIIGCISIGNLLYASWQIPRHITQPILYALIAVSCVLLYRRHYICYRYTLTDNVLALEETGGRIEKTLAVISLQDIHAINMNAKEIKINGNLIRASLAPKETQTIIEAVHIGGKTTYTISASEEFVNKLTAQWKSRAESII